MPGIYTHNQIAELCFNELGKPRYLQNQYNEFLLGSVGLEFFKYYNIHSPYKKNSLLKYIDICMYHHHNRFLIYLLSAAAKEVDLMMYYLGFITNYCSNKTIRPFSYYSAEKPEGGADSDDVEKFDQMIDTYYYKKINLAGYPKQSLVFQNNSKSFLSKVSKMLSIAINKTLNKRSIRPISIEHAFDDAMFFTSKLSSDSKNAVASFLIKNDLSNVLTPPKFVSGNDPMNLSHRSWRSPWNNTRMVNYSLTDLVDKSVKCSVDLINVINGYFLDEAGFDEVEIAIGNVNFDGRAV